MANQNIICRCGDVTREHLMDAIAAGCETVEEIMRATGAGQGPCQGRTCRPLIAKELAAIYHIQAEKLLQPEIFPPAEPFSLQAAAAYGESEGRVKP